MAHAVACHAGTPTPQLPLSSQFLICNKKPALLLVSQFLICDKKLAKNAGCSFYRVVSKARKCTVQDSCSTSARLARTGYRYS